MTNDLNQIHSMISQNDRDDLGYDEFLRKHGLSEDLVRRVMLLLPDPVANEEVDSVFGLIESDIEGLGIFALRDIKGGEVFPASRGHERFTLPRYVNHSNRPNAVFEFDNECNGWLRLLVDVPRDEEITTDYSDNLAKSQEIGRKLSNSAH